MIEGRTSGTGENPQGGLPPKFGKGGALGMIGLAGLLVVAIAVGTADRTPRPITSDAIHGPIHGTITRVDAPRLHFSLHDDGGRRMDLTSANVDAMRALQAGDHVRVDLDGHGIALNINKTVSAPHPVSYSRGNRTAGTKGDDT